MKRFIAAAFSLLLILPSFSYAEKITATGDPWPPFLAPDIPNQGIALEIVRAAFKTQGYEVDMKFVPWARALGSVKAGSADILVGTWWTEERTKFLTYSDSYLQNEVNFIKRAGDSYEYDGLESLSGKSVGIVRGYGYKSDFMDAKNFKKPESKDLVTTLKKLVAGRVDLAIEDVLVARALIAQKAPELMDKLAFTKNSFAVNKLHVTSGIKNPKSGAIIQAFNKGLAEIKENGSYDEILKKNGQ
ncbi:transporter substrate-binding domain-containing protein [Neptunomonas sp.]|uniref:transporter substrate-binding domain-containing protein n=1 Tax=Neptunomonas sp. TaxID=1971898 RepID=UPI0025E3A959|nr:transporter substrate-binding domain-containing protein [Neptunomonas sp.]